MLLINLSFDSLKWSEVTSLSRAWLFATLWTVVYKAPLSMDFSRQEYRRGLPFPFPGDLPDPGIEPRSPALRADALPSEPPCLYIGHFYYREDFYLFFSHIFNVSAFSFQSQYSFLVHFLKLVAQSCPTLSTPWTVAYQAPLSMGFSRQECWSGLPLFRRTITKNMR